MLPDTAPPAAVSPSSQDAQISPEVRQTELIDRMMRIPGAQAYHYLVVRHLFTTQLPLAAFTLGELCRISGKCRSTVKEMKRWFIDHGILTQIQEVIHLGQDSGPWDGKGLSTNEQSIEKENNHRPEFRLCVEKLDEIGWGRQNGHQVFDPALLIQRFGTTNILYALWCAGGKKIKTPAAYVTWQLIEKELKAPAGWTFPHPPVDTTQETPAACRRRIELVPVVSQAEKALNANEVIRERVRKRQTGQHALSLVQYNVLLEYHQYVLRKLLQRREVVYRPMS